MKRTLLILAALLLVGCSSASKPQTFQVGVSGPAFALEDAVGGKKLSIQEYKGKQPVMLFFSMGPG